MKPTKLRLVIELPPVPRSSSEIEITAALKRHLQRAAQEALGRIITQDWIVDQYVLSRRQQEQERRSRFETELRSLRAQAKLSRIERGDIGRTESTIVTPHQSRIPEAAHTTTRPPDATNPAEETASTVPAKTPGVTPSPIPEPDSTSSPIEKTTMPPSAPQSTLSNVTIDSQKTASDTAAITNSRSMNILPASAERPSLHGRIPPPTTGCHSKPEAGSAVVNARVSLPGSNPAQPAQATGRPSESPSGSKHETRLADPTELTTFDTQQSKEGIVHTP